MKKALGLLVFSFLFMFAINFTVKAETYQATELTYGQHLNAGDVIEFGGGSYNGKPYDIVYCGVHTRFGGYNELFDISVGQSYVLTEDFYVENNLYTGTHILGNGATRENLYVWLEKIWVSTSSSLPYENNSAKYGFPKLTADERLVLRKPNEDLTITVTANNGIAPYLYEWRWSTFDNPNANATTTENSFSVPNDAHWIICFVWDSTKNTEPYACGRSFWIWIQENDKAQNNTNNENDDTGTSIEELQIKSELPYGTVKCGNGGKGNGGKDAIDIKVLTPESRDTTNQNAFAKNYFKNRSFSTIFSYNVYPPYGVNNGYKNSTRIIYWADTGLKQGDEVYAVWYCQSSKKGAQMIKCDIDANGIVSIRIPQIGDMSTITLIKVK